ncbi:hypothetical protein [Cohaesibacter celericrescens]|uniref:hypothetical protein n=1 Tax=Cohaesibacter celericrescens TaxID=2067669 RepID=UPI003568E8C9
MDASLLQADCERCAALCCFALAFDVSDSFPIDKPNGIVCPQLGANNRCKSYDKREELGYSGCMSFDCQGAGQKVTQEVFGGRSWRDEPALLAEMTDAFVVMRRVHEQIALLLTASALPLTAEECDLYDQFAHELSPPDGWTQELLEQYQMSGAEKRVKAFLMSLRHHVA